MAAREVIYFALCVQLNRGATFPANALRDSTASPPGSRSHLLDLLPPRPDGAVLSADAGGLCV